MAKQTFTVGQVLTAEQLTSLQATALGGGAASAKTASYTLVAADAGTTISMTSTSATTITVNTGLFAAGDTVFIQNLGSGNCTVTAGTATVSTAGSAILPTNDAGILYFVSTGVAIFYDFIQTGAVSPLTTKGDLYGFSTLDARIPIGANDTVLTADSTQSLGLKWAAPAAGGMTLLSTTTLSGASTTLSGYGTGYVHLYLYIYGCTGSANASIQVNPNNSGAVYSEFTFGTGNAGTSNGNITLSSSNSSFYATNNANAWGLTIENYANTNNVKPIKWSGWWYTGVASATFATHGGGVINQNSAINSLVILRDTGTLTGGTALLYGVK